MSRIVSGYGFYAVISAIKSAGNVSEKNTDTSNYNPATGYNDLVAFKRNFTVAQSTNIRIFADVLDIEAGCDELRLTRRDYSTTIRDTSTAIRVDSRTPEFSLEWTSDGNNRQAGFIYEFENIDCFSNDMNITLSCSNPSTGGFSNGYCTGQRNTFTFIMDPSCTYMNFNMSIIDHVISSIGDSITVTSSSTVLCSTTGNPCTAAVIAPGVYPLVIKFESGTPDIFEPTLRGYWNYTVHASLRKFNLKHKIII